MKKLFAFAVLAALGLGTVGCTDVPDESEIDPNPVADQDAMANAIAEMAKRRQNSNEDEDVSIDPNEVAKQSAGGNK